MPVFSALHPIGSPSQGPELPVRGRISLFSEREGHARVQAAEARRPPYLVACLVGRPERDAAVQILKAYAHSAKSPARLLMVDSDYERETLDGLIGLRWLARTNGVRLTIDKPPFDISPVDDLGNVATPTLRQKRSELAPNFFSCIFYNCVRRSRLS